MTRREARAEVLSLVFESSFRPGETAEQIIEKAVELRNLSEEKYIKETFTGIMEHLPEIDSKIEEHSSGWKTSRISPVALAIMRLAVYEMAFRPDVPSRVAVNEALELVKIYDDPEKVRAFVNGILNAVMKDYPED